MSFIINFLAVSVLLTACAPVALADWQYLSRPDLSPPKLNITVPAQPSVEPGYLFIAPYRGFQEGNVGPEQPGAYIFRDDGDLVWSGTGYLAGWVADFGPTTINGKSVLRAFQGRLDSPHGRMYGDHSILNNHYETLKVVRTASHRLVSCHEFQVVDGGRSVLIETPVSIPTDLSSFGGADDQKWLISNGFQELDIATGDLLFEWYSADHVTPNGSAFPLETDGASNARSSLDAWNYFHINSVDKDDEGNYLISARNYAALFKINGTSGEILWQLGGSGSDFDVPPSAKFAYQHDARFRYRSSDGRIERISLFDNAYHSQPGRSINPFSRARYIELDHTTKTVREIHTYRPRDNLVAQSQGNVQFLPGGNVFVNWGQAGAVTEYSDDGDVLFHAYLDSYPNQYVQSYRGFRYPWTGYSSEEPAVLALSDLGGQGSDRVSVYVSWNGDTETDFWNFYLVEPARESGTEEKYLGKKKRSGFETSFQTDLGLFSLNGLSQLFIVAEARDRKGNVLGRNRATALTDKAPYSSRLDLQNELFLGSNFDRQRLEL
ncbi:ASST-domain-containing protein [Aspergillus varians]